MATFRRSTLAAIAFFGAAIPAWPACPPGLPAEPVFHLPVDKLAPIASRAVEFIDRNDLQTRAVGNVETKQLSDVKLDPGMKYSFRVYTPLAQIPLRVRYAFVAAGEHPTEADWEFVRRSHVDCIESEILRLTYEILKRTPGSEGLVPRRLEAAVRPVILEALSPEEQEIFLKAGKRRSGSLQIISFLVVQSNRMTLSRLLELSLNWAYFGLGSYGVTAAAMNYFGKPVDQLSLAEAAYLAGLPKAPNNYHPIRRADRAAERRNQVLDRMVEMQFITAEEAAKAKSEPLKVVAK